MKWGGRIDNVSTTDKMYTFHINGYGDVKCVETGTREINGTTVTSYQKQMTPEERELLNARKISRLEEILRKKHSAQV